MWLYIILTITVTLLGLLMSGNAIKSGKYDYLNERCFAPFRLRGVDPTSKQAHLNRVVALLIFILLFAVSALRIAVGNDYWPYRVNFLFIHDDRTVSSEIGFNLIVKFMQWVFGLDNYIPIFALFSFITALFMVKAVYDLSEWNWLTLFMLMANGYYFSSFTSVRYYMALAVALFSLKYVIKKDYIRFVAAVLLAAVFFHKSVLLVLIMYPIARINFKKWHLIIVGAVCAGFLAFPNVIRRVVFIFYPYYEGSYLDDYSISYVNILKAVAVLVLCLIFYKDAIKDNAKNKLLFNLNIMALIVFSCLFVIPETTRIGYYFSATNIFLVPSVLIRIKNRNVRIGMTLLVTLAYGAYFAMFLRSCYEVSIRLLPYMSWVYI